MNYFKCTNCDDSRIYFDKYKEKYVDISNEYEECIKYYECKNCNKIFTEKEALNIKEKRLKETAKKLMCSVEMLKYIERLEEKINKLEEKIENKVDKPCPWDDD